MFYIAFMNDVLDTLEKLTQLLTYDKRVCIPDGGTHMTPESLVTWLASYSFALDIILLDGEYRGSDQWPLNRLIAKLRQLRPDVAIVCLTEDGSAETVRNCITAQASGVLLRRDLTYGISAALTYLQDYEFLYSPSLRPHVERYLPRHIGRQARQLPRWQMYTRMRPALQQMAILLFLRGLKPKVAASIAGVQHSAIAPMRWQIKQGLLHAIEEGYYDFSSLRGILLPKERSDEWIFQILTCLPTTFD